ncbi:hypothetical protein MITS9509_01300 [Synechococcus sp. MIT S9509]|nr:hypothetical protein MITS9504_02878 [Synechococcus sp. MIT S9504]KZR92313.1 hypothetical protein MITS9509_01300 [Synechococcus sp. MIT S9509]
MVMSVLERLDLVDSLSIKQYRFHCDAWSNEFFPDAWLTSQ